MIYPRQVSHKAVGNATFAGAVPAGAANAGMDYNTAKTLG
jgi:hypothetical protein